jgi:hypothetical protein
MKAIRASAAVTLTFPVAVAAKGTRPNKLQKRIKKKTVSK